MTPGRHAFAVGSLTVSFHVHGHGPACIFHPGGPGVGWTSVRSRELERLVTAVYVEPIGTGGSSRLPEGEPYTLRSYGRCLAALIEHLGAGPLPVVGHSHGGFVLLEVARTAPHLLAGLVLYDTAARTGPAWWAEVRRQVASFEERYCDRPELEDVLAALDEEATATTDAAATSALVRQWPFFLADPWGPAAARYTPDDLVAYAGPNLAPDPDPYDVRGDLAEVDLPTLIVVGRHDRVLGPRWSDELHDRIAGSELVVLQNSGHVGHLEQPDAFAGVVGDFVLRTRS